ncbi:MAG TPA: DMT family transporter [Geminicoccaceae bacterium]|nr:DMT family transporter [Geminicoccaceae bacterium]
MTTQDRAAPAQANPLAYLLLTLTALCWGANAILGRLAVGEVSPMVLTLLRWLLALALFVPVAQRQLRRDWPALRRHLPFLVAMGTLGFTGFNALYYVAAHYTTAVNLGIIQGSIPVFVLIGAFALYRSPVTPLQVAGVTVTMLGVVLVGTGGDLARIAGLAINRGDLLMLVACLIYAGYTVALQRRPPVAALSLVIALAAAALLAALPLVAVEAALGRLQWPTPAGWVIAVLAVLFPSFLAQIFFIRGVELIGPGRAGVFINLVPVFASILAVAILGESFAGFQAIALGLVLGGIGLSERGKR